MTTQPNDPQDPNQASQQPPSYPGDIPGYPQDQGANPYGRPVAAPEAPQNILNAVKLMYVGAGLGVLGVLISLFSIGDLREEIEDTNPGFTESEIDTAYTLGIVTTVVIAGIAAGLWIWMAQMNKKGRSWARIVATVLGGLNIVYTLLGLTAQSNALVTLLSVVSIVLAGAILWLLYRPDSSAYYQAVSQSRVRR